MTKRFLITSLAAGTLLFTAATSHAALVGPTKFDLGGRMSVGYKAAVSQQADGAFAAAWGTGPVTFGAGGIPVFYVSRAQVQYYCASVEAIACHANNGSQIYILVTDNLATWLTQYALDHEILETMVDPYPETDYTYEVCDPLDAAYMSGPYALAEWVGPSYFNH